MTPADGEKARLVLPVASQEAFVLEFAREAPLLYGYWRHVKGLYKEAEVSGSPAVLGTLIGRLDAVTAGAVAAPECPPELMYCTAVVAEGSYACVVTWRGMHVLDLSGSPRVIGSLELEQVKHVAMAAGRAYVMAVGPHGVPDRVYIVDLSDPTRPAAIGSLDVRALKGLHAEGHYLFLVEGVGSQIGRLRVFDVSAPDQPWQLASLDLPDAAGLAVADGRAYVNTHAGHATPAALHVVQLSDPRHPLSLGRFRVDAAGVVVGGKYLPGSRRGSLLWAVDTSTPPRPPAPPQQPGLIQRTAELFTGAPALAPEVPRVAIDLGSGKHIHSAVVHRGHVYVGVTAGDLEVFALNGPERPVRVGGLEGIGVASLLAAAGDQLHVMPQYGCWHVYDLSDPAHPARLGEPPHPKTFAYMKRRARRFLRGLSRTDPDRYAETAFHALVQSGQGRTELDPAVQWVSVDTLYGRSGRYAQARHGRGPVYEKWSGVRRRTREERCPEAWDRRPDLVRELYTRPGLPWQTRETMLKILWANRVELPPLSTELRLEFLRSPSLLRLPAVREVAAEIEAGKRVEAESAARAFFFASGSLRGRLGPRLLPLSGSPNWARPFAASLTELLAGAVEDRPVSRRVLSAAGLLTRGFSAFISAGPLFPLVERLLASDRPDLARLGLAAFRAAPSRSLPEWLELWARLPEGSRGPAWEALTSGLRGTGIPVEVARELVTAEADAVRETGWSLLLALSPDPKLLAELWEQLLAVEEETAALRTAIASPAALELLRRSGLKLDQLAERVTRIPALAALLSPEALATVTTAVPTEAVFTLIRALSEARWPELRDAVLRGLKESGRLASFWKAAPAALTDSGLQRRLIEDPVFAGSFLEAGDPALVEITDPPFETLLHQWVLAHAELFTRGSAPLLTAATHPLPAVREWALGRVRAEGMDLSFALRLLESAVPPSMALGRTFFEAVPPGDPAGLTYALALCDSPERAVRAYGREFIQARWDTLPQADVVRGLAEHGDPEANRFLAELLARPDARSAAELEEVRAFDRGVLRARNRGRRAKEQVKERLSQAETPDVPLLLELARSGTPRDAEWALSQLARLAAEGHVVEGLSLDGVAGV